MSYAIINVGGKQYRVQPGQRLLVDRLAQDEGATFQPRVLLLGGDGDPNLEPAEGAVTARVVQHVLGDKIRIGKYRQRTGYKRHNGFRARLSQIEIEAIGGAAAKPKAKKAAAKPAAEAAPADAVVEEAAVAAPVEEKPKRAPKPKVEAAAAEAPAEEKPKRTRAPKPKAEETPADTTETEASDGA